MPSAVDAKQTNFKDYVQGACDNAENAGMGQRNLRLPRPRPSAIWPRKRDHKVGFLVSAASARVNNTDNLPQLVMTVGAMGGLRASRAT
ncbi:MAG: hypothetical protein ACLSDQ_02200 [Adlercreutzia equolifaciens]